MTTFRGLRIHQGRMKCGGNLQQQPCAAASDQTRGTKGQVENHSANGPIVPGGSQPVEEGPVEEIDPPCAHQRDAPTCPEKPEPRNTEEPAPARRNKIKWPKTSEAVAWRKLDSDLSEILERSVQGSLESRLNLLGDILYQECKDRFGVITIKKSTVPRQKGRREREIEQLVLRRRQLRKGWRKATPSEREGLKVLWEEIKQRLANLRRAEHIRRRRKRKEKERATFFKNPFKHARQLLEEAKSGRMEVTREELEEHIRKQYSDPARTTPLGAPGHLPRPEPPVSQFNILPPRLREFVRKARAAAAPGPNGVDLQAL